jgi:hypothetical protein
MNDDRQPTDWPDDRLADAFRARADAHPTPSDLSAATIDRIRRVPRTAATRDRFVRLGGLVAAAAVVAIVAVALAARPSTGPSGDDGPTGAPTTFGLPVLSVDDAVAIRDSGVDDREIAIHGFLSGRVTMSCPFIPHPPNPTELRCAEAFTWLMSAPESIVFRNGDSVTVHGPTGPALNPGLALVDTTGVMPDSDAATPVAFIGHFDDRRADLCAVDIRPTCADTFIVDRIDRGTMQTVTFNDQAAAGQTDSEIDALINRVDSNLRIISRRVVAIENLGLTEPVYQATPGGTPSYVSSAAWVVTALPPVDASGRAIARTFVIFDGTDIISEITRKGPVQVTLGEAPSSQDPTPTATPSPSPSGTSNLATVIGKPITVTEAIDHRDNHLDATETMVRGYGWAPSGPIACTAIRIAPPALDQCPDGYAWIGERKPVASGPEFPQPDGPAFNLLVRRWTYLAVALEDQPREVLAFGHFDDARAAQCAPELVERCRRNFLVDAILDPARGWPADNASSPSLSCGEGLPVPDCAAAAGAALESLGVNDGVPTEIEIGRGVWCPTPGLLFLNTSCPGGGLPPADGGQWIANALVTFRDSPTQAYLNIARSGSVFKVKAIALATPPPSPN